jgi:hypothetical protein
MRIYNQLKDAIKIATNKQSKIRGIIISGPGGMGKSYDVTSILKEDNICYHEVCGVTTALGLFNKISSDPSGVYLLDDLEGLGSEATLSFLKGLLETKVSKTTSYSSSSATKEIDFNGTIILISNKLKENAHLAALRTRCLHLNYSLSSEEILLRMKTLAASASFNLAPNESNEIFDYLKSHRMANLNLRSFVLACEARKSLPDSWRAFLDGQLKTNEEQLSDEKIVQYLTEQNTLTVFEMIQQFHNKTGKSRRTFFNIRAKIKQSRADCATRNRSDVQ